MSVQIIRGDARTLPLADNSVDLIVTSPPYFGLRSYQDNGVHYSGQLGDEATPAEFVDALIACTAEWMRVLKPSGSMWVNLGDKYASGGRGTYDLDPGRREVAASRPKDGARPKSLLGIPWRYALRCIDDLGLILRSEVIWSKPNGLPESVTDRVRRSHEQWFHFTLEPRYFSAVDEIRLPTDAPRRAGLAAPSRPALGPEVAATFRARDGATVTRGWCHVGSLEQPIRSAVTGHAERFEVAELVGFLLRVEGPERDYVVDLQATGAAAPDAHVAVSVEGALADLAPTHTAPRSVTAQPSGVLVAGPVVGDALRRAEVLSLECAPIAAEGIAARITLDLHPGRATLLVWDAYASRHADILPQRSDPLGKLPGSVWQIPTEPLRVPESLGIDHFAAFPTEWPRRIIQGWSPSGVCVECGEGRRPVTSVAYVPARARGGSGAIARNRPMMSSLDDSTANRRAGGINDKVLDKDVSITGYACACPEPTAPTTPAVILDPFGGTGTTALVAHALGRHGISNDMSADYCRLAAWRTSDPGQIAKVRGERKPVEQIDGQEDLFGEVSA